MEQDDTKPQSTGSGALTQTLMNMPMDEQSRVLRRLWVRLAETYGHDVWERRYGVDCPDTWAATLGTCTLADLRRGVDIAARDDSGRLPTVGQFRAWCREYQPGTFAGAAAPPREYPALPALADMCGKTNKGKQWHAFMKLEGMIPMGTSTMDDLDRDLGDADIDEMRRKVAAVTPEIRQRAMRGA